MWISYTAYQLRAWVTGKVITEWLPFAILQYNNQCHLAYAQQQKNAVVDFENDTIMSLLYFHWKNLNNFAKT